MDEMERRREPRFKVEETVMKVSKAGLLSFLEKPREEPYPVVNLSIGGLEFVVNGKGLRRGQRIKVHLDIPAFDEALDLEGRVRWTAPLPDTDAFTRVGIQFRNIEPETQHKLNLLKRDGLMRKVKRNRDILV